MHVSNFFSRNLTTAEIPLKPERSTYEGSLYVFVNSTCCFIRLYVTLSRQPCDISVHQIDLSGLLFISLLGFTMQLQTNKSKTKEKLS